MLYKKKCQKTNKQVQRQSVSPGGVAQGHSCNENVIIDVRVSH